MTIAIILHPTVHTSDTVAITKIKYIPLLGDALFAQSLEFLHTSKIFVTREYQNQGIVKDRMSFARAERNDSGGVF